MPYVYCLYSTQDGVPRYIGRTEGEPERRLNQHLARALEETDRSALYEWIRSVLRSGHLVDLHVLQQEIAPKELDMFEKYWISQFTNLVNTTYHGIKGNQSTAIGEQIAHALAVRMSGQQKFIDD
jgi:hypothetical protein